MTTENPHWQRAWQNAVQTADDLVRFVNAVGCCTIGALPRFPAFPSQEVAMGIPGVIGHTWFWKDDLHTEQRLYYTRLFAGVPGFIACDLLPAFIATNGAAADELLLTGGMSVEARAIYRIIEERGPIPIKQLKALLAGETKQAATRALIELECRFIITKTGITGRERGTYGYIWDLAERWLPDAFPAADRLGRKAARALILERLGALGVPTDERFLARVLRW